MFLAAVYKSPQGLWSDIDITELLGFKNKSILAGDPNAKHPVWNSKVSYTLGLKFLELFISSNFEISAPHCSTCCTLLVGCSGHCSMSERTTVRGHSHWHTGLGSPTNNVKHSGPRSNERSFRSSWKTDRLEAISNPTSELITQNIQIHSSTKADKGARDFSAPIASAYRLEF
jgi:hypothetical protein